MKKIILASALALAALSPAPSAIADDYNGSRETTSSHSRSYYSTEKYDHSKSLPDRLARTRWQEMRQSERETLTEALTGNFSTRKESERKDAMREAKDRWQKMSLDDRREVIMAWQRAHPHDMGPMSENLEDVADQR